MTYITTPRPRYVASDHKLTTTPRKRYVAAKPIEKGKLITLPRGVKAPGPKLTTLPRGVRKEGKRPFIAYADWQATEKGKLTTLPRGVKA